MLRHVVFVLVLSFSWLAFAANSEELNQRIPLSDYFSETWDTRNGLPHNSINSIAQTDNGYLWLATWEGLARYNGRTFTLFTRGDLTGLPDSGLRALVTQNDGSMLVVGSRGGVSQVKHNQWHAYANAPAMINHILKANNGDLWFALEGAGVYQRPAEHLQSNISDNAIINGVSAYRILQDHNNTVWAATNLGLYRIKQKTVEKIGAEQGLPETSTYTLLLLNDNRLVVGTEKGAWLLENNKFTLLHPALAQEAVTSLMQDVKGDIWVGTINHGVFRLSPIGIEKLDDKAGLPSNRILSLMQDKEQSIWIGTNGGLFRLREAPFTSWTQERGLSGNYIRTLLTLPNDDLLIGSSNGLNLLQNKRIKQIFRANTTTPTSILSLAMASNNEVWVGSYTDGLLKYSNGELTPFLNRALGLSSNEVRAILVDTKARLWIGTAAGLDVLHPDGKLQHFTKKDGLPGEFIMALAQDSQGKIWVGTGVGVARFDDGQFKNFYLANQFDAEYAFGFHVDKDYLWMTTDRGLIRYSHTNNSMSLIGRDQGLPVDKLFQLVPDNYGSFWLTSNRGVIRISETQAHAVADNRLKTLDFELYGESDGMVSAQANGGSNPSAILHSDGSIWIATAKGAATVKPQHLQSVGNKKLPIVIESFTTNNRKYSTYQRSKDNPITLSAGENHVMIQYAGLGFIMSDRIRYQTKLDGFDNQWVARNQQSLVEYTNLPPGSYNFKVRASYPYGEWHEESAQVDFVITPYYWQKLSFKISMLLLFGLVIFLIFRWRSHLHKLSEAKLKQRIAEQTQDLKQQSQAFEHQATHDQLTGVPNRRAFDKWLIRHFNQATKNQEIMALAIMDIDYFKQVNDKWSHIIGDRVICTIADLLIENAPKNCQISRWGGEEFTIMFPLTNTNTAAAICEELRQKIAQYDFSDIAVGLSITASFGISDSSKATDYDRLLSQADQALYHAKSNGRNQVSTWQPKA